MDDTSTEELLSRVLGRLPAVMQAQIRHGQCEGPRCPELAGNENECDHGQHFVTADRDRRRTRRCPVAVRDEIRTKVAEERRRLDGVIKRCTAQGELGWAGWRDDAHPRSRDLREAAEEFVRRVCAGAAKAALIFQGPRGTGKTWALLETHFALLDAGIRSEWLDVSGLVRQRQLRLHTFDDEARAEAQRWFDRLACARVLIIPDLGDPETLDRDAAGARSTIHEARAGEALAKAAELFDLLEASGAATAVATNATSDQLIADPGVGSCNTSRLMDNAIVVKLDPSAKDQRVEKARAWQGRTQ